MIDTQDDRKVAECHSSGRSVALNSSTLVLLLLAVCCLESRAYGWGDVVIDDFDQSATLLREKLVGPNHFRDPVLVSPSQRFRTTRIVPEPSGISFIATICFLIFWSGYARRRQYQTATE